MIFLDIDGVLVTPSSSFRRRVTGIDAQPEAVAALDELVASTGAQVVVSSTWRLDHSVEELREVLSSWGVRAEVRGVTPSGRYRCEEIQAWLDGCSDPVGKFVIIDDMSDMGHLAAYLVATDFEIGLTPDLAKQAHELLRRP